MRVTSKLVDEGAIILPLEIFATTKAGAGIVLDVPETGKVTGRLATAADSWRDIYGWNFTPPVSGPPVVVQHGHMHVDILAANTYYSDTTLFGLPVFFSLSTNSMSLTRGTDGVIVGTVHARRPLYDSSSRIANDIQIKINSRAGRTDPTTLDLDLTLQHDPASSYAPYPSKVGDLRLVICDSTGAWSDDETLTVQGGGQTLATLDQGSAVMYQLSTLTANVDADNNPDGTYTTAWTAVTNKPFFHATVHLHPDLWRAQCAKLHDGHEHLVACLAAKTTGQKGTWTVMSTAPAGTSSNADGYLSIGGQDTGEIFRITATESGSATATATDAKIVPMTATAQTYQLLGGNCLVSVGPLGIRVNHVATGAADYAVTTDIWELKA